MRLVVLCHPFAARRYTLRNAFARRRGNQMKKLIRQPVPVGAASTLRYPTFVLRKGMPGEIIGVEGTRPAHYTVKFWPNGLDGGTVIIPDLIGAHLVEA